MRRPILALCVLSLLVSTRRTAEADTPEFADDPRFSLTLHGGILRTQDDQFKATWMRPFALRAGVWLLRSKRHWLNGLQVYGGLNLENLSISYREGAPLPKGLYGIGNADLSVPLSPVAEIGLRLSLYDNGRWRLAAFGDADLPITEPEAHFDRLEIDDNGNLLTLTTLVRDHSHMTLSGRMLRAGLTGALRFAHGSWQIMPYVTIGWMQYRAQLHLTPDRTLSDLITTLGLDPSTVTSISADASSPFCAPGIRMDITRNWSLDAQALVGRYDGTNVLAVQAGLTWRFGR